MRLSFSRPFLVPYASLRLAAIAQSQSPLSSGLRSRPGRPMSSSSYTPPSVLKTAVKLSCVQLAAGADKAANLSRAAAEFFPEYAETLLPSPPTAEQSPSFHALASMAADNAVYLVGGSIPEREPETGRYYNTSLIFGPDGRLLDSCRKVHLFDIDIPGKITFRESDVLSAGDRITLVDLPEYGKVAVAICYDVRFPELASIAARRGAFAFICPGAFNLTTGELHWKLLARARAVDNQMYVAMCSPARDMSATYNAWGHSMVVDPMANVLVEADETTTTIQAEMDGAVITEARRNIPLGAQRRFDVYPDVSHGKV
ncbi:nitrilase family protein [Drechmeria coniospora]|uniref:Nitrilase family protein n=1 Tax=Drechmeria coniospora TaxID=98403 RepID=A0A151GMP4_DRECN|nr:nitrilase family protein [Drechmeria coniospora]KYK58379.1 nitrilase family protein [Drechmeria coniospora]